MNRTIAAFALSFARPALASATPSINVGDWTVTIGQSITIPIFVTGGDAVVGVNFNAQIGDGGVLLGGTSPVPGTPFFTAADIITGTIFAGNNIGANDLNAGEFGNLVEWFNTMTNTGTVSANGLLATLTISAVGAAPGTYPLVLGYGDGGEFPFNMDGTTDFGAFPANIIDGHIIVETPEPSSIVLGLLSIAGLAVTAIRRRLPRR